MGNEGAEVSTPLSPRPPRSSSESPPPGSQAQALCEPSFRAPGGQRRSSHLFIPCTRGSGAGAKHVSRAHQGVRCTKFTCACRVPGGQVRCMHLAISPVRGSGARCWRVGEVRGLCLCRPPVKPARPFCPCCPASSASRFPLPGFRCRTGSADFPILGAPGPRNPPERTRSIEVPWTHNPGRPGAMGPAPAHGMRNRCHARPPCRGKPGADGA